jgi:alpha-L-fucosidase 2
MQQELLNGRILAAQALSVSSYTAVPNSAANYNTLGDLVLNMSHASSFSNYERYLDLENSTNGVYYVVDGVAYFRELIASNPDHVIAMRLVTNSSMSFTLSFNRPGSSSSAVGSDTLVSTANSGSNAPMYYAAGARVKAAGGTVSVTDSELRVDGAYEAIIYITAATSFRTTDQREAVLSVLSSAGATSYQTKRAAHVRDYQSFFLRNRISIGTSSSSQRNMETADRVLAYPKEFDPELVILYYQLGRYLLISSSRNGSLPANLQGVWNQLENPMWGSRYTLNINLGEFDLFPVATCVRRLQ